jgi:hypothetical protein
MTHLIMDHDVSGCFGISSAPGHGTWKDLIGQGGGSPFRCPLNKISLVVYETSSPQLDHAMTPFEDRPPGAGSHDKDAIS